ncbi:TauD/TfdA family dioxygenase [Glaciimonas sp. GG7]
MQIQAIETVGLSIEAGFPFRISPVTPGASVADLLPQLHAMTETHLHEVGAILFTGFGVGGADAFQHFAASFGHPLLNYEFGSTPRSKVGGGIYTSTEYPAHQHIPLHNEQAYTREWPMKIWFYCDVAAQLGGETPIADSRAVYRDIAPEIRQRFIDKGLLYVRNYGNGLDLPWQRVFNTDSTAEVEAYCHAHDIGFEWSDDGDLRTSQRCQGVGQHPVTGESVWFNQAHLFHISTLDADTREILLDSVGEENLPRNVYYGDGSPIADTELDHVRAVLEKHTIAFAWQQGDVLMLDNMLAAHARAPFTGPRKVMVAMAEGHGER